MENNKSEKKMKPFIDPAVKNNLWFRKIQTKEEAVKVIKDVSNGFFVIVAVQLIASFAVGATAIVDAVVLLVLAVLLRKLNSRTVAIIIGVFSLLALISTSINKFGGGTGGRNVVFALIMIYASYGAIVATFKYHKLNKVIN